MEGLLTREINLRIYGLVRHVEGPAAFLCECDQVTCPATTIMLDPSDFEGIVASAAERLVGQAIRHRAWSSSASKAATSSSSRPRP